MSPDISRQGEFQTRLLPQLLDLLIDPAFIVELKEGDPFVISGANTAFLHLMGSREKEEILGQSFEGYLDSSDKTPLFLPEDVASDSSPEKEALRQDRVLLRKDKSRFLSEIRMKRLMFGEIPFLLGTVRDITEMAQQGLFQEVGKEIEHYEKKEQSLEYLLARVIEKISGTFPFPEVIFSGFEEKSSIYGSRNLPACSGLPQENVYYAAIAHPENRAGNQEESMTMAVIFRDRQDLTPSLLSRLELFSRKMEKALRDSQQPGSRVHRDVLFELAPDGICLLDSDSLDIIDVNPVFCRLLGFPDKSFLVGTSILDWWELTESSAREILHKMIDVRNVSFSFEQRHIKMDGSHLLASISGAWIPYGVKGALMLHVRDVTTEHEDEILNRISVELDQKILSGLPIMDLLEFIVRKISLEFSFQIVFFTIPEPSGGIVFVGLDPSFPKYSPVLEELFSMNRWDRSPGRESSFGRAIRSGLPQFVTGDEIESSPPGSIYNAFGIASIFSIPVPRDAGQLPWGALTIADHNINDLSGRLRTRLIELAERIRIAFMRHEEMDLVRVLKLAMESSRNIEIIAFKDGRIEWANESFFKMIRSDGKLLPDIDLAGIFPEPAVKGRKVSLIEAVALSEPFTGEFEGATGGGHRFLVETMIVPLKDRTGKADRVLIQQKDITRDREIDLIDRLMNQLDEMILLGTPFPMLSFLVAAKAREIFHAEAVAIGLFGDDGRVASQAVSSISPVFEEELREWGSHVKSRESGFGEDPDFLLPGSSYLAGWMNGNRMQEFRRFSLTENNREIGYIAFFFKRIAALEADSLARIEKLARRFSLVYERYQQEEQRRLHETAMSAVANGILITGSDRQIQWVNDAFLQMSGHERDDLIGQVPFILRDSPGEDKSASNFWKKIFSGETFEGFLEDQKKDGSRYMVEATVTPILINDEIRNFVVIQKDQTQRIQQEQEFWRLAHTDHLTGLLNRQAFMERINLEIGHCQSSGNGLALLFLDMDGFKEINDTWGHGAGDYFLKSIGERILAHIRSSDIVARIGGDEFVVLLEMSSEQKDLGPFLDSFVKRLSVPVDYDGRSLQATVSIGVSFFPKDALSAEEMIRKADMAMYASKNMGKNRWSFCRKDSAT